MLMSLVLFSNNAQSTLALPIAASDTSLSVASGTGSEFPSISGNQYFTLTLIDAATGTINEICYVTARNGDTMTVKRGQEGTSARAWGAGDTAANLLTSGTTALFTQAAQLQKQAGNYATDGGSTNAILVNLNPAITSSNDLIGVPIRILVSFTNTGPTTLTVNGIQASVGYPDGSALKSGALQNQSLYEFVYVVSSLGNYFRVDAPQIQASQLQQQSGNFAVDTGSSGSAIVISLSTVPASMSSLVGAPIRFKSNQTVSGPCTLNVNGLGNYPLQHPSNVPTRSGSIYAGGVYTAVFDGSVFHLQELEPAYNFAVDTGSTNNLVASAAPSPPSYVGYSIKVKVANSNTGATRINVDGLGNIQVVFPGAIPLIGGELVAGGIYTFTYDGLYWLLEHIRVKKGRVYIRATGNGTFTVPGGVFQLTGYVTGGGGGGSNINTPDGINTASGGAGSAGATEPFQVDVTPGQQIPYYVGPGGGAQYDGADSSFGNITAKAGRGASFTGANISPGGFGGVASSTGYSGGDGGDGQSGNQIKTGGGNGGASYWGGGGRAGNPGGHNGQAPGSGGGGAYQYANSNGINYGGSGANGIIEVNW